jgi:peptide/nickel transport system substrate-binding protein
MAAAFSPRIDAQFNLRRRTFVTGGSALALAAVVRPKTLLAQSVDLGGRDPKTLVVLVDATVGNLDPATNVEWAYGLRPVYETLTVLQGTETLKAGPSLATAWESNADASSWTFTLATGAMFHDGTVCDADAVKKSIIRLITLPYGQGYTWQIDDPATQIVVIDAATIRFDLGTSRPFFDLQVASQYGFWIASPTAAEANSTGPDDMGSQYLQSNPVGTGPYKLEGMEPGQSATFAKNDAWRGGWDQPHFDRVITRTLPLSATRRQLLESGEADITLTLEPEDIVALKADDRFVLTDNPTFVVEFVSFATDGILADPRARQAICHAFDHDGYIRDVTLNTADKPTSVFPSIMQGMDSTSRLLPYDPDKARALLAEAGLAPGTELTMASYEGFGDIEGQILQAWLADIGITLNLQEMSFPAFLDAFFGDAAAAERPDMFYFSWWPNVNHPYSYAASLFSGNATSADGNSGRYSNPEATGLIDALNNQAMDADNVAKFLRLADILTTEDPAWLPIQQSRTAFVTRSDITGLVNNPIYVSTLDMLALSHSA